MVKFSAETVTYKANKNKIADFFSRINNLQKIMPSEIEQWEATGNRCSFHIKNLGTMSMEKGFVNPDSEYEFISTADSKVDFTLTFRFQEIDEQVAGAFEIQTEINPFLEMIVKRPLTNFVNILTKNLQEEFIGL
ncbi:MAG TPA: hypothetical protein PLI65_06710 [Bacteroidales bacterium]|nr:hypothetical protein [Bacteroidales bacterium]HPR58016.1 hypothetical protein [Bacteroidales bacterium]HRW97074.1 hypothetical protein [Bacteroidales bacterium]